MLAVKPNEVRSMITKEQHAEIKERLARLEVWVNGRRSYPTKDVPADCQVTNEERSSVEVYEFITNPPDKYFLYIRENPDGCTGRGSMHTATTWTGEYLGDVCFGKAWRNNFGDKQIPITVHAINGKKYHGTYYTSSGNYARIKLAK